MIKRKTIRIAEHQRVLMFKQQKFVTILGTGEHKFWDFTNKLSFQIFDINSLFILDKTVIRLLSQHSKLQQHIQHWKLAEHETGLLSCNGLLLGIVAPGEHLYVWKDAGEFELKTVSLNDQLQIKPSMLQWIKAAGCNNSGRLICSEGTLRKQPVAEINVEKQSVALLFVDGMLVETLSSGQYGFWQFQKKVEAKMYDLRQQTIDISGQEILTKDRVSLRLNLSATYRVKDAVQAATSVEKLEDYLYKMLQLALREAVGSKTLDELLIDKLYINETVKHLVEGQLQAVGVILQSTGVKDIILPGEMKAILNQVVEAQKAAEANVIRRREETNATRSLLNTAKVMENNPTLLRLKELEALEKVAEKINNLTVYGGLENLMTGLVKLA